MHKNFLSRTKDSNFRDNNGGHLSYFTLVRDNKGGLYFNRVPDRTVTSEITMAGTYLILRLSGITRVDCILTGSGIARTLYFETQLTQQQLSAIPSLM